MAAGPPREPPVRTRKRPSDDAAPECWSPSLRPRARAFGPAFPPTRAAAPYRTALGRGGPAGARCGRDCAQAGRMRACPSARRPDPAAMQGAVWPPRSASRRSSAPRRGARFGRPYRRSNVSRLGDRGGGPGRNCLPAPHPPALRHTPRFDAQCAQCVPNQTADLSPRENHEGDKRAPPRAPPRAPAPRRAFGPHPRPLPGIKLRGHDTGHLLRAPLSLLPTPTRPPPLPDAPAARP